MTSPGPVRDDSSRNRYALEVDGETAFAAYERRDGAILFTHTQVPAALEGRGVGSALVRGALADVRAQGLKVVPLCAFVAAWLDRHPEEQDLLALDAPG